MPVARFMLSRPGPRSNSDFVTGRFSCCPGATDLNLSGVFLYSFERLWKRTKRKEGDDAGDREEQRHDCRQLGAATTGWTLDGAREGG
jgi:hypothetical protein